jgi:hypothetical protein
MLLSNSEGLKVGMGMNGSYGELGFAKLAYVVQLSAEI